MKETWRWYGPDDPVTLDEAKQAGATGIVTALHHLYGGERWPFDEVRKRKEEIEAKGLVWSVVESIPIHNSIKLRSGPYRQYTDWWKDSIASIAKAGVKMICYNFMPIINWTRTDLRFALPSTGLALRFDAVDFAAYDLYILRRPGAEADYDESRTKAARARFEAMPEARRKELDKNLIAGLVANEGEYTRETILAAIAEYKDMTPADLRAHLIAFLKEVVPVAEENGVRLGIHPDDPPLQLFGLPRVVSTADDARAILAGCDTVANGLTFCVGSYGVREDNDLLAMVREFAPRIHFAHLRQVQREGGTSFHEAPHLDGSSDMVGIVAALLREEKRRRTADPEFWEIPMRPDHGHLLADDIRKPTNPGYSLIGRLKGLAELRGVVRGLEYTHPELA